jgi:hypothetical protein
MGVVYLFDYQALYQRVVVNDGFMIVAGWTLVDVLSIPYHLYLLTPLLTLECVCGVQLGCSVQQQTDALLC